jgi:hypothetical protein
MTIKKELLINLTTNIDRLTFMAREAQTANSAYKKLAVQWLNEAECFVSSSVVADSFVLRNRQLIVAANKLMQANNII